MKTNSFVWDDNYFYLIYEIERAADNNLQPPFFAVSVLYLCDPHKSKKTLPSQSCPLKNLSQNNSPINQISSLSILKTQIKKQSPKL
jgi:hypothetical protein